MLAIFEKNELNLYRVVCVLGAIAYFVFGYLRHLRIEEIDYPLWMRFLISALSFATLVLSYTSTFGKKYIHHLLSGIFYLIGLHFFYLNYANNLEIHYAAGFLLIFAVLTALFSTIKSLLAFVVFMITGALITGIITPDPVMDSTMFIAFSLFIGVFTTLSLGYRISISNKLEESEQQLQAIMETANDAIISADFNGNITYFNPAAEKIFGYSSEEITGNNITDLMPEKYIDAHKKGFDRYRMTGEAHLIGKGSVELEGKRKDGTLFPIELSLASWHFEDQEYFTAIIREISERKEFERKIYEKQIFLDSIIEHIPAMIFVKDAKELRFVLFNKAGEELVGFSREEMIGKNDYDFFPKQEADFFTGKDREVLDNKILLDIPEEPINTRHKGKRILHTVKVPVSDEKGRPIYLLGISEDITDRRKTEAALQYRTKELARSNEELEHFAYVASHDLQEPLRMVSSFSKLLSKKYTGKLDKNAQEYINFITDGVNRMSKLIDALLEYSRVSTRAKPPEPVSLNSTMEDVKANLQTIIEKENAELIIRDQLPVIKADPTQMLQLFQNLISNSLKFRKKEVPPRIEIRSEEKKDQWVFSVKDNGIGIDEQFKEKVFQIFQRLHGREEYPGTGIGLALCKKIVERHGGTIWFESKPGEGTVFYFTLAKKRSER